MTSSIDDTISQLAAIKERIKNEQDAQEELSKLNLKAVLELEENKQEIKKLQVVLEQMRVTLPDGPDDEKMYLDVGGRMFRLYRSTLSLFKDSMLAVMVSTRWSDSMRKEEGALFLDMDPDDFQEIVRFLRRRRINPEARSSFSSSAAELAEYLGVPVDNIVGSQSKVATFPRVGTNSGKEFVFEVFLPYPATGCVTMLKFSVSIPTECAIYTKAGVYKGALASPNLWKESWTGNLEGGLNSVPLCLQLKNGDMHSIYIYCKTGHINYSKFDAGATFATPEPMKTCVYSGRTPLLCTPGSASNTPEAFVAPEAKVSYNEGNRVFAGEIVYATCEEE